MKYLALMMVPLLTSCAATTPEIRYETKVIDTACSWVQPITISRADVITDGTARLILAHNRQVKKNCP
jgi:hypothetical protein